MIVVISDLHLNDDANRTISESAFEIFRDRVITAALKVFAKDKERGKGKKKEPIPRDERFLDIILNGDILDYIRSEKWRDGDPRPWDKPSDFEPIIADINDAILERNAGSLAILKSLSSGDCLPEELRGRVRIRVHYLVGNHDWFLVLPPTKAINEIRAKVADAIGLHPNTNRADAPFPHDPLTSGCDDLLESMRRHRVFVRHGDVHDRMNFPGERGKASIGDAIVIEILSAIATETVKKLDSVGVQPETRELTRRYLREIDNLRPYAALPLWLESLLVTLEQTPAHSQEAPRVSQAINDTFRERAAYFRTIPFVRNYRGASERRSAQFPTYASEWLGIRLPALQEWMMNLVMGWGRDPSKYRDGAYSEQWLRQGLADTVVYGHTHAPEVVPLDMVRMPLDQGNDVLEWTYVNSGTWRPVQQRCVIQKGQNEFSFSHTMTHVSFFTKRERSDHAIDFWTGILSDVHFPVHAARDLYMLSGRLGGQKGKKFAPPPGNPAEYRLDLYDSDLVRDDKLGSVIPNSDWTYRFGFLWNEFHEIGEGDVPEPRLDIFRKGLQVKSVKYEWPAYAGLHAKLPDIEI